MRIYTQAEEEYQKSSAMRLTPNLRKDLKPNTIPHLMPIPKKQVHLETINPLTMTNRWISRTSII